MLICMLLISTYAHITYYIGLTYQKKNVSSVVIIAITKLHLLIYNEKA